MGCGPLLRPAGCLRHGAVLLLPFRPPRRPATAGTLIRAYPVRARARVGAGAVRAPDCPRARQAAGAALLSAESGSFRMRDGAGGKRSARISPPSDPSYHGFSGSGPGREKYYLNFMNILSHPVAGRGFARRRAERGALYEWRRQNRRRAERGCRSEPPRRTRRTLRMAASAPPLPLAEAGPHPTLSRGERAFLPLRTAARRRARRGCGRSRGPGRWSRAPRGRG